jgi:hypothetical protein
LTYVSLFSQPFYQPFFFYVEPLVAKIKFEEPFSQKNVWRNPFIKN